MSYSVLEIARPVRRRLKRIVQKHRDKDYARRALAVLQLWETRGCVSEVARRVCAARSSVNRWRAAYEAQGEAGIAPQLRGREDWKATAALLEQLRQMVRQTPGEFGYLRSRWSSELLALALEEISSVAVHATTVRRWLRRLRLVWRRARPTLCIRDPRKRGRMSAITRALNDRTPYHEVFYVDEADIALNPRIGAAWMPRGEQMTVPTPGKNAKHYIAGALHTRTGRVVWAEHTSKSSALFIALMEVLLSTYRRARRLTLILDNYSIHRSQITQRWLASHPKLRLLFQPAYHPWVNRIERLWKALHDTVTRNHRYTTLDQLMRAVRRFLEICQPFPGSDQALAAA